MSQVFVPFGGLKPAAATVTTLFTSPVGTVTMLGSLTACNTTKAGAGQDDSIRVYVVPSGQVFADKYLVLCDMVVDEFDPYVLNTPIILNAGDVIQVYSQNGNVAFNGAGLELTGVNLETYAAFGGIAPGAATPTVLYTAAGSVSTMSAWVTACPTGKAGSASNDTIRVWVVPSGQSVVAPLDQYLVVCDLTVDPFDTYLLNTPIVLTAGDSIVVQSGAGAIAFNGSAQIP